MMNNLSEVDLCYGNACIKAEGANGKTLLNATMFLMALLVIALLVKNWK